MKTNKFGLLGIAGLAASAFVASSPVLAHDGYGYAHTHYGAPRFAYPGHRVVVVRPPVFAPRPVVVYETGPVYYEPAPVYPAPTAAATLGGAIAAGTLIGAVVGNGLAR